MLSNSGAFGYNRTIGILLPCILQYIRYTPPHTGKSSPSLAVVELAAQNFPTLDFLVPAFGQKHRVCL